MIGKETGHAARKGDILGYARVSTADQDASGQKESTAKCGAIAEFGL